MVGDLLESKEVATLERGDSVTARVGPRFKTDGASLTLCKFIFRTWSSQNAVQVSEFESYLTFISFGLRALLGFSSLGWLKITV